MGLMHPKGPLSLYLIKLRACAYKFGIFLGWSTERFDCDSRNLVCMNIFQQLLFTNLKKTSNLGSDPTSSVDCCYCWCCFPSFAECCLDSPRPPGAAQTPTSPAAPPSSSPSHSWVRADGAYAAGAVEDEMGCCRWPAARDGLPDQRRKYSNLPPKFIRTRPLL